MTTINTANDLLTLLRENHEFREAVRQAILTEELLALPAVFNAFASEIRSDIRRLEDGQKRLEDRQERLEDRQEHLEERFTRLEYTVNSLRGTNLEMRLTTKLIPLVGREFNVRRIYPIWTPGVIAVLGNTKEFQDRVEQAMEDGIIDDDDEIRLRVTDLIIRSQSKSDRSTVWFTVEASGVINDDDITRSKQSATAIGKIYGDDAVPLVYGYGIQEDQVKLADELGVQVYIDPDRP